MLHDAGDAEPDPILIVEDNEVSAFVLRAILRKQGYDPQVASNGTDGVAIAEIYRPKLVFMDLQIPGLDGYAAAVAMRQRMNGSTPVLVAVTASTPADVEMACRDAGFTCVLPKPIRIAELLGTVERYLGSRQNTPM